MKDTIHVCVTKFAAVKKNETKKETKTKNRERSHIVIVNLLEKWGGGIKVPKIGNRI